MDIAVIKTGGKQYVVKAGQKLKIEKLTAKENKITFDDILGGGKVTAKIMETKKGPKVRVLKFHPKKRYKRNKGHRQTMTEIEIEKIA